MDKKNFFNNQLEQHQEKLHIQFEEKQLEIFGQSEWLEQAYNREIARFQLIVDAINASPNHTVTINGYTCEKDGDKYCFGVDER